MAAVSDTARVSLGQPGEKRHSVLVSRLQLPSSRWWRLNQASPSWTARSEAGVPPSRRTSCARAASDRPENGAVMSSTCSRTERIRSPAPGSLRVTDRSGRFRVGPNAAPASFGCEVAVEATLGSSASDGWASFWRFENGSPDRSAGTSDCISSLAREMIAESKSSRRLGLAPVTKNAVARITRITAWMRRLVPQDGSQAIQTGARRSNRARARRRRTRRTRRQRAWSRRRVMGRDHPGIVETRAEASPNGRPDPVEPQP